MALITHEKKVGDISVSYLHNQRAADTTILFVHGFPFEKAMWRPQLEALPAMIQGIACDVRGFGESTADHGFFSIDLFAADLLRFIDELELKRVILCGLSMGGYIALRAFEREPQHFSGLILCDTNASADKNESKLNRFASIEKLQSGGRQAFTESFLKQVLCPETLNEKPEITAFVRKVIDTVSLNTLCAAQLAMASRTDTTAVLSQISVPTLIIRGEEDALMTTEQAAALQSTIPHSQLAVISKSGHLPNLENAGGFNARINRFLEQFITPL